MKISKSIFWILLLLLIIPLVDSQVLPVKFNNINYQLRVNGFCSVNSSIRKINIDGTVVCQSSGGSGNGAAGINGTNGINGINGTQGAQGIPGVRGNNG